MHRGRSPLRCRIVGRQDTWRRQGNGQECGPSRGPGPLVHRRHGRAGASPGGKAQHLEPAGRRVGGERPYRARKTPPGSPAPQAHGASSPLLPRRGVADRLRTIRPPSRRRADTAQRLKADGVARVPARSKARKSFCGLRDGCVQTTVRMCDKDHYMPTSNAGRGHRSTVANRKHVTGRTIRRYATWQSLPGGRSAGSAVAQKVNDPEFFTFRRCGHRAERARPDTAGRGRPSPAPA